MKDFFFVPGLKKNLLSISALDAKGIRVAFVDGKVLMWLKVNTIDDVVVIGEQDAGLYKLKGQLEQDLVHESIEPNEIFHRRFALLYYRAVPLARKVVEGLLEL